MRMRKQKSCLKRSGHPLIKRKKRKGKKEEDLSNFETVETRTYKLEGEARYCPECGKKYSVVTKETVKRLRFVPAKFEVEEEITYVYSCPKCGAMNVRKRTFPDPWKYRYAFPCRRYHER